MSHIVFERDTTIEGQQVETWHVLNKTRQKIATIRKNGNLALTEFEASKTPLPLSAVETIAYGARLIQTSTMKIQTGVGQFFTVNYDDIEFEQTIGEMVKKCTDDQLYPFLKGVRMMLPKEQGLTEPVWL